MPAHTKEELKKAFLDVCLTIPLPHRKGLREQLNLLRSHFLIPQDLMHSNVSILRAMHSKNKHLYKVRWRKSGCTRIMKEYELSTEVLHTSVDAINRKLESDKRITLTDHSGDVIWITKIRGGL